MGRRSRHRLNKRKKGGGGGGVGFIDEDELMALSLNGEDKPRDAKQTAKMKRRLKKEKKKEKGQAHSIYKERMGGKSDKRWDKIEVIGSEVLDKTFLYTSIGSSLELEFQPLGFHKIDNKCCFFLENNEPAATAIHSLSKRIQDSSGNLLKINLVPMNGPNLALNSDQLQVLREVMSRRYNANNCLLDLTDLHHDPVLLEKDILAPLTSVYIMKQVVRVIKENIPHLKALNLSKNNLRGATLYLLQNLHTETSQLFALNLEHNAIKNLQELRPLKVFPITEVNLQFNPVVEMYKNMPYNYIELAKKCFPHLKLLDTVDAQAYLAEKFKLPQQATPSSTAQPGPTSTTAGASSSAVSEQQVRSFLEQYYALIDTQDRGNLIAAYTPDAVFEIKSNLSAIVSNAFMGQEKIKEALVAFPSTQHQLNTFSFKIEFPNPSSAQASIIGKCQISGLDAVVTFARKMNIVPFNAGFCCSLDILELR